MSIGWDPERGRFIGTFPSSMMAYLWLYDGVLEADGRVLTLSAEGPSYTDEPGIAGSETGAGQTSKRAGPMPLRRPAAAGRGRMGTAGYPRSLAGRMLPARGPDRGFFRRGRIVASRRDVRPCTSST
jgi:hypothetical protein